MEYILAISYRIAVIEKPTNNANNEADGSKVIRIHNYAHSSKVF